MSSSLVQSFTMIIAALLMLPYIVPSSAAAASRYQARDVDALLSISDVGWTVPLRSGKLHLCT